MTERSVLRSAALVAGMQAVGNAIQFFAQRIILSHLTKEDFGSFFLIQQYSNLFLIILVDLGLNTTSMRYYVQAEEKDRNRIMATFFWLRAVLWGISTLFSVGFALMLSMDGWAMLVCCVGSFLSARALVGRGALETSFRANSQFFFVSSLMILDLTLFTILIWTNAQNLTVFSILMYIMISGIPGFLILLFKKKSLILKGRFDVRLAKTILISTAPFFLFQLLSQFHDKIDVFLLQQMSTEVEVGIFGAGYRITAILFFIEMAVISAFIPVVARSMLSDDQTQPYRSVESAMKISFSLGLLASSGLAGFVIPIVFILTDNRYAENTAHIFLYSWAVAPIFILVLSQELNTVLARQKNNVKVAIVLAVLTPILNLILIPSFNSYGTILAKVITVTMAAFTAMALLRSAFPDKSFRPLAISMAMSLMVSLSAGVLCLLIPNLILRGTATVCATLAILILTGILNVRELLGLFQRESRNLQ